MSVSTNQIIAKLDQLMEKAKGANEGDQRGYLIAMASLLDLVLEQKSAPLSNDYPQKSIQSSGIPKEQISLQARPVEIEEANGDSILDF